MAPTFSILVRFVNTSSIISSTAPSIHHYVVYECCGFNKSDEHYTQIIFYDDIFLLISNCCGSDCVGQVDKLELDYLLFYTSHVCSHVTWKEFLEHGK